MWRLHVAWCVHMLGGCGRLLPPPPNIWTHRATRNLHISNLQHTVYRCSGRTCRSETCRTLKHIVNKYSTITKVVYLVGLHIYYYIQRSQKLILNKYAGVLISSSRDLCCLRHPLIISQSTPSCHEKIYHKLYARAFQTCSSVVTNVQDFHPENAKYKE